MTDTQVMAALEVTQADYDRADEHRRQHGLNSINRDHMAETLARHRIASSPTGDAEMARERVRAYLAERGRISGHDPETVNTLQAGTDREVALLIADLVALATPPAQDRASHSPVNSLAEPAPTPDQTNEVTPRCRDCKLYDLDAVKNARGAIMANRVGACRWRSKEQWPESVREHLNSRPSPSFMQPNDIHRCPCFQKVDEVTHG